MSAFPPPPPNPLDLTIIITTSPIRSHPSTALLESIIDTFHYAGPEFLACPTVIVCDGHRSRREEDLPTRPGEKPRKYGGEKAAMRSGYVNDRQRDNYNEFKAKLKEKVAANEGGFGNTEVLEMEERVGYGFALKAAVERVTTEFVCVIQVREESGERMVWEGGIEGGREGREEELTNRLVRFVRGRTS